MIRLQDLTLQAHSRIKASGMLYELYPEATGNPNDDLQAYAVAYRNGDTVRLTRDSRDSLGICTRRIPKVYFYDIQDEEAEYDF